MVDYWPGFEPYSSFYGDYSQSDAPVYAPAEVYGAPGPSPGYLRRQCWVETNRGRAYGVWQPC
jgi:hypothetical protein